MSVGPGASDSVLAGWPADAAGGVTALGLALSRGLTEAMGGTLEPDDTPGGGLTMTLSLPAAPGPVGQVPPGLQEAPASLGRPSPGRAVS